MVWWVGFFAADSAIVDFLSSVDGTWASSELLLGIDMRFLGFQSEFGPVSFHHEYRLDPFLSRIVFPLQDYAYFGIAMSLTRH